MTATLTISTIIPVLHEQQRINDVISHLRQQAPATEIIVVDGDPTGSTLSAITDVDTMRLTATAGRGNQLSAGIAVAAGDILLMLHADTILPDSAFRCIRTAIAGGGEWGSFRLGIDAPGLAFRIIERVVDLRCQLFSLPYGDQAIFVTRQSLDTVGSIQAIPLMEDLELALRLNRFKQRFVLLSDRVVTSARHWEQDGITRRTLRNWLLLLRYLTGADPADLVSQYR